MAFESGTLEEALASAAGDDFALMAELRHSYVESAERHLDLLGRARCDGNWEVAALRLRGLASSFHDEQLQSLADYALVAAPGEPIVLRQIAAHLDEIRGQKAA